MRGLQDRLERVHPFDTSFPGGHFDSPSHACGFRSAYTGFERRFRRRPNGRMVTRKNAARQGQPWDRTIPFVDRAYGPFSSDEPDPEGVALSAHGDTMGSNGSNHRFSPRRSVRPIRFRIFATICETHPEKFANGDVPVVAECIRERMRLSSNSLKMRHIHFASETRMANRESRSPSTTTSI